MSPRWSGRARRALVAAAFGLGLVLLVLGVGEVACRLHYGKVEFPPDWDLLTKPDPDLGRRFVPGSTLDFALLGGGASIPVRINRDGYRGPDWSREKPAGVFRVACLGDSTTFGWRIREEEAYPALLGPLLEPRASGRRVEVLNFGAPEHTTFRARFVLEDALRFSPDLVVFAYGFNDSDISEDEEVAHARRRENPESLFAWRVRRLFSGTYLRRWVEWKVGVGRAVIGSPAAGAPSLDRRVPEEKMLANLRGLVARAREKGAGAVLVNQNIPSTYGRTAFREVAGDSPLIEARSLFFPLGNPTQFSSFVGSEWRGSASSPSRIRIGLRADAGSDWDVVGARSAPAAFPLDRAPLRDDGAEGDEKAGDGVHSLLVVGPFAAGSLEIAFVPRAFVPEVAGLYRSRNFFFSELRPPDPSAGLFDRHEFLPGPPSPPMLPGDPIHPDPSGHRRIAEAIAYAIEGTEAFRRFAGR